MSISNSVSRFGDYYKRHGLAATTKRFHVALKRSLFASRMVVLYCDLDDRKLPPVKIPESLRIERIGTLEGLGTDRHREMTGHWNPKVADQNIRERFQRGASLWIVECEGRLAGYGWTIAGESIAPYYFPLGANDVQFFDFYVFPRYRGRALHWLLTGYILYTLAREGKARAFADTGEWNQAQSASFKMTPFRPLGMVRTYTFFGTMLTRWSAQPPAQPTQKGASRADQALRALR